MIFVLLWYLVPSILVSVCNGHRKLLGGQDVTTNHPFMVYLRKAEVDPRGYIAWLCGGALVGPQVVLTSAACVEDVQHLYVVAGYDKYVSDKTKEDSCLTHTIRKVTQICVPKAYDLIYDELDKWANYDIAVIKVDASIVGDPNYKKYCSYEPQQISINYNDKKLQDTDAEAMVLGWGHAKSWRQHNDKRNFNKQKLQYVSTLIYDKKKCLKAYKSFGIDLLISKYMICTLKPGLFDDKGENINKEENLKTYDGCSDKDTKEVSEEFVEDDEDILTTTTEKDATLEDGKTTNKPESELEPETDSDTKKKNNETEKQVGICQNDHGGPLISWTRSTPKVIGVASVFQVKNNTCTGPFLFTSTYCSSKFLKCVVDSLSGKAPPGERRSMPEYCYLPPKVKGFDIIQRSVLWKDDDDKHAVHAVHGEHDEHDVNDEHVKYLLRPQKPLSEILKGKR